MPCKNQKAECVFPHNPMWKQENPPVFSTTEITHKRCKPNIPYIPHTAHFPNFTNSSLDYNIWVCRPYPWSSKCSEKPRPIPAALFLLQCVVRAPAQWHFQPKHFSEIHDLLNNKPTEVQITSWDSTDTDVKSKTPVQKNWFNFFFFFLNHSPAGAHISCSVKSFQTLNCVLPVGQCTIQ